MFDISHSEPPPPCTPRSAPPGPSSAFRPRPPQPLRVHAPGRCALPLPWAGGCCRAVLLVCASILSCARLASASAAIMVDPSTGFDLTTCGMTPAPPCKTIAYAVRKLGAFFVDLSAGVFNESTVNITSAESLVISGVPSSTVFDCSSRQGPAFNIANSTVNISGVIFQACSNPSATGGAVSASGSSVIVSQCSFINCSAASGGAMSVSGPGGGLYLSVQNSNFTGNSAIGGLASCPANARQPCSTWGGAVAVFEILDVTVSGCRMVANTAQASVPTSAPQYQYIPSYDTAGGIAVAGGGCVSVLFSGNASGPSVRVSDSTFLQCTVTLSLNNGVFVGNGMPDACSAARAAVWCMIDTCTGYGGGLSVYFGLSAGLQLLDVASFNLALHRNEFMRCSVIRIEGHRGNVYGGGVSVYLGGYSSSFKNSGDAVAAVGDTAVRNASVVVETASFTSCSAANIAGLMTHGNAYGGSFSLYLGGYAWSEGSSSSSSSRCGLTTASGVSVYIRKVNSSDCSATTNGIFGANSYGGSMSVVYIGAYAWSFSPGTLPSYSSLSVCGTTNVTGLVVSISSSTFANSTAVSRTFCSARLLAFSCTDLRSSHRMLNCGFKWP